MGRTHLVIPDPHAHPKHHNRRAEWLGKLILDIKPDVVIEGGDLADMPSLSDYDKGKKSFEGRRYKDDINSAVDFNDRLWGTVRSAKRSMPERHKLIGNHEERIDRISNNRPELDGVCSLKDLQLWRYYDNVVGYDGLSPGVVEIDGVYYAHYHVSGVKGYPIGGEHPAHALLAKQHLSLTSFHTHLADLCIRPTGSGRKIIGCFAGCYLDYTADWCGSNIQKFWWSGVIIKRNVEDGVYDPEFVSMARIKKEYS